MTMFENSVWWLRDGEDTAGPLKTNIPHRIKHHSPTGFNVGYAGSGPADFALNIVNTRLEQLGFNGERSTDTWNKEWVYTDVRDVYQSFKRTFLIDVDIIEGVIPWPVVDEWLKQFCNNDNIQYFMYGEIYQQHQDENESEYWEIDEE